MLGSQASPWHAVFGFHVRISDPIDDGIRWTARTVTLSRPCPSRSSGSKFRIDNFSNSDLRQCATLTTANARRYRTMAVAGAAPVKTFQMQKILRDDGLQTGGRMMALIGPDEYK
ncbi:hypothetical protein GX51_03517 [Blastomyces parvus]|uniref:Uncharacterized protein n=1 Tax=Blastomyces parvus TaxID=2060905 RepID=A0A2B7X6S5_9EURO|nr:hypothetical protein GX51_03517 [Blastomyces parvus]